MLAARDALAFGLQALGSVATVMAAVVVTWRFGLSAQGEFALWRTWIDAASATLVFGLPQGLLHLMYREGFDEVTLWTWSMRWLLRLVATAGLLALLILVLGGRWGIPAYESATLAATVPAGVACLLWRSLILRRRGVLAFAVATAMPALSILVGVTLLAGLALPPAFVPVLGAAWWCSAVVVGRLARVRGGGLAHSMTMPRSLWQVSSHAWLQAASAAVLPAMLLSVSSLQGQSAVQVGVMSLGLHIYQLFSVMATYAAPMIYDRLARGEPVLRGVVHGVRLLAGGLSAVAALAPMMAARVWPALAEHVMTTTLLAVAGVAAMFARLLSTRLQAASGYRELSFQALARLFLAALLALVLPAAGLSASVAIPLALLIVECTTVLRLVQVGLSPGLPSSDTVSGA